MVTYLGRATLLLLVIQLQNVSAEFTYCMFTDDCDMNNLVPNQLDQSRDGCICEGGNSFFTSGTIGGGGSNDYCEDISGEVCPLPFSYCMTGTNCDMQNAFGPTDMSKEDCICAGGSSFFTSDTIGGGGYDHCEDISDAFCPGGPLPPPLMRFSYCMSTDDCNMGNLVSGQIDESREDCLCAGGSSYYTSDSVSGTPGAYSNCEDISQETCTVGPPPPPPPPPGMYSYCMSTDDCDMNNLVPNQLDQSRDDCICAGGSSYFTSDTIGGGGGNDFCEDVTQEICPMIYSYCMATDDCDMNTIVGDLDGSRDDCLCAGGLSYYTSDAPAGIPGANSNCEDISDQKCPSRPFSYCMSSNDCNMDNIIGGFEDLDLPKENCICAGGLSYFSSDQIGGGGNDNCEDITGAAANCQGGQPCSGSCVGDPHFKTFGGNWFDFHGICDLVLLTAPGFLRGLGIDIHIRTKPRYVYSFIEAAAIKIGDDILEVGSFGEYMLNGVEGVRLPKMMAGQFVVTHEQVNKKRHTFRIQTGANEAIVIGTFKDIVSVSVENITETNWGTSVGMMGSFQERGALVGRNGTVISDYNLFGQEWQVKQDEGQFFQSPSPFMNLPCVPPAGDDIKESRRLGEASITEEAAALACAHHKDEKVKDICIFDVLAMGDMDIAEIHGAY